MEHLSRQEDLLLEQLIRTNQARLRLPVNKCKPISHPEKYANPIGIGSDGELFDERPPVPPAAKA